MLGPGRVSMDCSFSCYLAVTLKPKRFNSFYRSICIPDNQTGSWPWGPWRSCRAVPHTHGCSGGKPHGGLQSWIPRCPGCCCPRWGSPHPLVLTLEGSRPGQGVEEEGAGHAFPILLNTKYLNKPQEKSPVFCFFFPRGRAMAQRLNCVPGCHILPNAGSPWKLLWLFCPTDSRPGMSWPLGWMFCCSPPVDSFWAIHACARAAQSTWPGKKCIKTSCQCSFWIHCKIFRFFFFYWGSKNAICGAWASLTNLDHADAEKIASTAAG